MYMYVHMKCLRATAQRRHGLDMMPASLSPLSLRATMEEEEEEEVEVAHPGPLPIRRHSSALGAQRPSDPIPYKAKKSRVGDAVV